MIASLQQPSVPFTLFFAPSRSLPLIRNRRFDRDSRFFPQIKHGFAEKRVASARHAGYKMPDPGLMYPFGNHC